MQKSRFLSSLKPLEGLAAPAAVCGGAAGEAGGHRFLQLKRAVPSASHGSVPSPCRSLASLVRRIWTVAPVSPGLRLSCWALLWSATCQSRRQLLR